MSAQLNAAIAAGNLAEAATLAFAQAGMGTLPITGLIGVGDLLAAQGRRERAIALYQLWLRHADSPLQHAAWYNLAVLQMQEGDERGAEQAYRRALELQPGFIEAYLGLGALLERRRDPHEALAIWHDGLDLLEQAAASANGARLQAQLLNNIGRVADTLHHHHEAEDALARSLRLDPRQPLVAAHWLRLRQRQCVWPLLAALPGLDEQQLLAVAPPGVMLAACDDPALQRVAARRHLAIHVAPGAQPLADSHGYTHRKLRIGYLSPDTAAHAVSLYARHDRRLVEVYGFCWAREDHTPRRLRLIDGLDHHVRLAGLSDLQAAQLIRAQEIDILVDLCGLDDGGRPGILAHRPAPVQIAWPGYAGTTALDAIDYVLADTWALPPALVPYFAEQPLYLPDCAHILDRPQRGRRRARSTLRAEYGLPRKGFVFCCFAASDRLAPDQFAMWMRILRRVPGSVLWLASDSESVRDNLRVAALRHGVASARLYFTDAVPAQAAIAADLFLDTLPCNAGAAASDALRAGLPLLTCSGRSYAARTSGSLLHAAGLAELIAADAGEYEDAAVRLAGDAGQLAELRQRLADSQDSGALFDTPRFVRHLEQLYQRVARGTLQRSSGAGRTRAAAAPQAAATLPLISILVTAHDANDPEALERTVLSALKQSWDHTDILVSDSSNGDTLRQRVAALQAAHPRLRYARAPGLTPAANLDHCLALSLGDWIAVAPQGEILHPHRLARMLHIYQTHPGVGLVACWRHPQDQHGNALPAAPPFSADTLIGGPSLGSLLLSSDPAAVAPLCDPAALLLPRGAVAGGFGRYQGQRYSHLGGIAVALAALGGRDGVFLASPLGAHRPVVPPADDDDDGVSALARALEGLRLLYAAHAQQIFLADPAAFRQILSARLAAVGALIGNRHATLPASAAGLLDELQDVLRLGYKLLFS